MARSPSRTGGQRARLQLTGKGRNHPPRRDSFFQSQDLGRTTRARRIGLDRWPQCAHRLPVGGRLCRTLSRDRGRTCRAGAGRRLGSGLLDCERAAKGDRQRAAARVTIRRRSLKNNGLWRMMTASTCSLASLGNAISRSLGTSASTETMPIDSFKPAASTSRRGG
jgi:hypothetical protein